MEHTLDRLKGMRLTGMAEAYRLQTEQPDCLKLSFEERLSLLVDYEWTGRQSRALHRLLKKATLRYEDACLENLDYQEPRGLDRLLLNRLATGHWLQHGQSVLTTGATGTGKTYIACALGNAACRLGFSVLYYRTGRLLDSLAMARGDGSYLSLLDTLRKTNLLILDDWALNPLTATESREILNVIEERNRGSMVIASQMPLEHWHEALGDLTVADAILDRIVHSSHRITLKGDSMRKRQCATGEKQDS